MFQLPRVGALAALAPRAVAAGCAALAGCAVGAGCAVLGPPGADGAGPSGTARVEAPAPPARAAVLDSAAARALAPLPSQLGDFCLDAYAEVRAYGPDAPEPLERACEQVLGPGCDDQHGLERVTAARYVDAAGGRQSLDVVALRFADADSAYAGFSDGLLGERDPSELTARPFDAPGVAVLDRDRASAWLGRYALALDYGDDTAPTDLRVAAARVRLTESTRRLLAALPADTGLPLAVRKLPTAHRLPLGVRLVQGDALGVRGMGEGAVGYYADGDKRWRVLAIVRPDAEAARDVLSTLARSPAARKIYNAPLEAYAFTERRLPAEPVVGWVVGQHQDVIYGVGDEATALPEFMPAAREAAVKLALPDKLAKLAKVHQE
ncbi:MAG TPA: DUF6599 family protein [Polyangiaceae bacterium]|nr:DUF6599 family protein [Polyangiaceae bacterium]